jgi:AraC family transcriptional regulator of adaptative response/methylated-DNA-[protein]-cysteine methyltransferase
MRDLLERRAPDARLPMDVRATAFQRQVWEYVRGIPAGETRTYGEVASGIGRPSATRAVARACGSNPLALLTPCHRVIAADGALAGYRWGVGLKGALLAREQTNEDSSP